MCADTLGGRVLCFAPLLRPDRGVFGPPWGRAWLSAGELQAVADGIERRCAAVDAARVMAWVGFTLLFVVGPALTLVLGPNAAVVYTAVLLYPTVALAIGWLWWRRRSLGLSTGHSLLVSAELAICPPVLLNLVQKITGGHAVPVDGGQLAGASTPDEALRRAGSNRLPGGGAAGRGRARLERGGRTPAVPGHAAGQALMVVLAIIAMNTVVSLFGFRALAQGEQDARRFVFAPYDVARGNNGLGLTLSHFAHVHLIHLGFNMLALWSFSHTVLEAVGTAWYCVIYAAAGFGSDLVVFAFRRDDPTYRCLGASGSVSAIMMAAVVLDPSTSVAFVFVPVPIPGPVFMIGYVLVTAVLIRGSTAAGSVTRGTWAGRSWPLA